MAEFEVGDTVIPTEENHLKKPYFLESSPGEVVIVTGFTYGVSFHCQCGCGSYLTESFAKKEIQLFKDTKGTKPFRASLSCLGSGVVDLTFRAIPENVEETLRDLIAGNGKDTRDRSINEIFGNKVEASKVVILNLKKKE